MKIKKLFSSLSLIILVLFSLSSCDDGVNVPSMDKGRFTEFGSAEEDQYMKLFEVDGISYVCKDVEILCVGGKYELFLNKSKVVVLEDDPYYCLQVLAENISRSYQIVGDSLYYVVSVKETENEELENGWYSYASLGVYNFKTGTNVTHLLPVRNPLCLFVSGSVADVFYYSLSASRLEMLSYDMEAGTETVPAEVKGDINGIVFYKYYGEDLGNDNAVQSKLMRASFDGKDYFAFGPNLIEIDRYDNSCSLVSLSSMTGVSEDDCSKSSYFLPMGFQGGSLYVEAYTDKNFGVYKIDMATGARENIFAQKISLQACLIDDDGFIYLIYSATRGIIQLGSNICVLEPETWKATKKQYGRLDGNELYIAGSRLFSFGDQGFSENPYYINISLDSYY